MTKIHFEEKKSKKEVFLKEQTICPVCNGLLDVYVEFESDIKVKEEGRCSQCMALSYIEKHLLH